MTYETPSKEIFQNRKRFHRTQKALKESVLDWLMRLQNYIKTCEFRQISDYMLIDKFVSGLSEADFETISQVRTWTIDELIFAVNSKQLEGNRQQSTIDQHRKGAPTHDLSLIKVEPEAEAIGGRDTESEDALIQDRKMEIGRAENIVQEKKRPLTSSETKRNYINRIKEAGKFEEYKRKKAEDSRRRRLQAKLNEQWLPPELQLRLIDERRRANRERMNRYRQQKSKKTMKGTTTRTEENVVWLEQQHHESTLDTGNYLRMECEIKQETSDRELDFEFAGLDVIDRLGPDIKYGNESQPDTKPKKTKRRSKGNVKRKTASAEPVQSNNVVMQKNHRRFECYLCALQCESLPTLKTHLKVFHSVDKRQILKCYACNKTTKSRELLVRHIRQFHYETLFHKCPCCVEKFEKRMDLRQHLKQCHPEYKPFVCEVCGISFRNSSDLWSHTRTHTDRKDSKCEICGSLFSTSSSRNKHMRIHLGLKRYGCKHCDARFREAVTLRNHLICVHGQGEKPFVCEVCAKRFVSAYHLKLHSNSHTGDRPYKCDKCGNSFTQPSSLKLHVRRIHEMNADTNKGSSMAPSIT